MVWGQQEGLVGLFVSLFGVYVCVLFVLVFPPVVCWQSSVAFAPLHVPAPPDSLGDT